MDAHNENGFILSHILSTCGHTDLWMLDPIRSGKLSRVGPGDYLEERSHGITRKVWMEAQFANLASVSLPLAGCGYNSSLPPPSMQRMNNALQCEVTLRVFDKTPYKPMHYY